jgi:hypothetical protein
MAIVPRLTTAAACRVARIDRDRLNEHIAAGRFPCAPETIPGRARLFDPDDMIALWLFREFMEDGLDAARAGQMACKIAQAARDYPDATAIAFVEDYFDGRGGTALPADRIPPVSEWDTFTIGGSDIRKVTTYRVGKLRKMIAHYTEKERAVIGERDE